MTAPRLPVRTKRFVRNTAANRQDMIEAKADIVLPEPQHRLQIVRRKSDVDDVFCELHLPHH
jgi:hypothetical protein